MEARAVKVTLPKCLIECISRAYNAPAGTALRKFIIDVFTRRVEKVDFPEECEKCIEKLL